MVMVPASWMPAVRMDRIIVHWTAGTHNATEFDRKHYHLLIEADGKVVRGIPSIADNVPPLKRGYAAHTASANSYAIGVSMCCMGGKGVKPSPFTPGPYPMTRAQWVAMVKAVAELCTRYGINVTPSTVLSHAEVEKMLGKKQKGKWDISHRAFDLSITGAIAVGNIMRTEVIRAMGLPAPTPDSKPVPNPLLKDLQTLLNAKGYAAGPADGAWGPKTMQGLNAFLISRRYTSVTRQPADEYLRMYLTMLDPAFPLPPVTQPDDPRPMPRDGGERPSRGFLGLGIVALVLIGAGAVGTKLIGWW
jgi:hypothetical protein